MYQPNQPMGVPPPPSSSNRTTIIIVILIALLFIFLAAIIAGALGYWIGSRPAAEQAETAKNVNSTVPTPVPTASPTATPTATPTPTPTPEVGGKYTGPTGDVDITNVSDKSFEFNIGVGNSNGSGQIDGQATRTSPTLAVYSKIPDPDLYNDPDSDYYHKKCHITFRFTAGKLAVSEDDFACNYWHGAAVDFNGTFSQKKK
jgi:hypothetical protein